MLGASAIALAFSPTLNAQMLTAENSGNAIHWAYAAFFGTGFYRIGDDQEIFVLSVRPGWELRSAEEHKIGIDLTVPVTVGIHNFDIDRILDDYIPSDLRQASVVPSVKLRIPMGPRWTLRPVAALGLGSELSGGESAWIYATGLRSRLAFSAGRFELNMLNGLEWFGYTPKNGRSDDLLQLQNGLEIDHPLGNPPKDKDQLWLRTHVIHNWYVETFNIFSPDKPPAELAREVEIGVALGKETKFKIWRIGIDRVGLAYRFTNSDDGVHADGIRFVFSSVFK